ncbi:MAG: enolase [Acidimicrobiia bacterium]|nr:enolase [Acidimicrobiia bacterium]
MALIVGQIEAVTGRRVWDSRGRPTIEVEIRCSGGATGRAIAPAGASRGRAEAVDLRDGGPKLGGLGVQRALANVGALVQPALRGLDISDQATIDQRLRELDPSPNLERLGGNVAVAASLACAWAAAATVQRPLWRYLLGETVPVIPLPEIQIFGGGAHASRRLDLQDLMVVCPGATSFDEALEWTAEIYLAAGRLMAERGALAGVADEGGWWPHFDSNEDALATLTRAIEATGRQAGQDVAIALDVAASELVRDGHYHLDLDGVTLDSEAMGDRVLDWCRRFPVISVEDPLGEDDMEGLSRFTAAAKQLGVQVVGDDALVTSASRVKAAAAGGWVDTLLLKPNQAGTLTAAAEALAAARAADFGCIASARSGETEDVSIVHLAVGWGIAQLKVGSITRGERTAKWNEVLRIEDATGAGLARPFP